MVASFTYTSCDNHITLTGTLAHKTLWLSLTQIALLFQSDEATVRKRLDHFFEASFLDQNKHVLPSLPAKKGTFLPGPVYSLESVLGLSYMLPSPQGAFFRKWVCESLLGVLGEKSFLEQGESISIQAPPNCLHRETLDEVFRLSAPFTEGDINGASLELILQYAKTWNLLLAYDEDHLKIPPGTLQPGFVLTYKDARASIDFLKADLTLRHESSSLFGQERDQGLESILHNIEQTFQGNSLYPTIEEKAAHLLYFVIKDHPFSDGNKRIGCFLFLLYLNLQNTPARLNENGLLALALLIAQSDPSQKETMINLVVNILAD